MNKRNTSNTFITEVKNVSRWTLPLADNSTIDSGSVAFTSMQKMLNEATNGGKLFTSQLITTYTLVYTSVTAYSGGVLAPNGDIHFVPYSATVGQKINSAGVVSTYTLAYTAVTVAYAGGVLVPNGDIYFIPLSGRVGQKINSAGVVSTYTLAYSVGTAYSGGVLMPNGDIYFIPFGAAVGQKITTFSTINFSQGIAMHPYFNKF